MADGPHERWHPSFATAQLVTERLTGFVSGAFANDEPTADLRQHFEATHQPHGQLTADATEPVASGFLLTLGCPCGVEFPAVGHAGRGGAGAHRPLTGTPTATVANRRLPPRGPVWGAGEGHEVAAGPRRRLRLAAISAISCQDDEAVFGLAERRHGLGSHDVRAAIRAKLATGELLPTMPESVCANEGTGRPCGACGAKITAAEIEYELHFPGARAVVRLHRLCLGVWDRQRKNVPAGRPTLKAA